MTLQDDFAVVRRALVQGTRAMNELVWTQASIFPEKNLDRIEEQFTAYQNFVEACIEIMDRSRIPLHEISERLDDFRGREDDPAPVPE